MTSAYYIFSDNDLAGSKHYISMLFIEVSYDITDS